MPNLAAGFRSRDHYAQKAEYSLLPFRFLRLDEGRQVITNIAGQHLVVPDSVIPALIEKRLDPQSSFSDDLESIHVLTRGATNAHMELLAAQIRTRQSRLPDLTGLHIFVVTLRCDHSCSYCQVSRVTENRSAFDMTEETADRAVDLMLQSPSRQLKIEFQGGEALLNFPLIQRIVRRVKDRANSRDIAFVIATNLSFLTDDMLDFCAAHQVCISTSLDGPPALHNSNRPRPGKDSHERTIAGINRCRERLGPDRVSALMTCTAESLTQPEAIIDEYVRHGFREIFLRFISPYGFAVRSNSRIGYETEQFLTFYRRGLAHILRLNREGIVFREIYSTLLLRRMLTSNPTGYVDLQSPAGAGLGVLVYNYDGDIYASDEGRMLAEMGDKTFRLGNAHQIHWEDLFLETPLLDTADRTMTECMPGCSECAFQPWCGSDPVFHHATQGDAIGHRPTSGFCRRNMEVMRHLVSLLEDDPVAAKILRRWAT
ncbi:MAG: His-Xaa-Ser system radical SAM maturase HxsB [Lacunisphaera sp.]